MSDAESFSSREQLGARAQVGSDSVVVRFEGDFLPMIKKLVDSLEATSHGGDEAERRRLAVATAVSTLSDFAREPLFVRRRGSYHEIEGLWRR